MSIRTNTAFMVGTVRRQVGEKRYLPAKAQRSIHCDMGHLLILGESLCYLFSIIVFHAKRSKKLSGTLASISSKSVHGTVNDMNSLPNNFRM